MTEIFDSSLKKKATRASAANRSFVKMLTDRLGAALGLIVLSPLLLAVAVLIKRDSPGPVLFVQERYGRDGKTFKIFKFRTMSATASQQPFRQAVSNDDRITRLGRFLRASSIDELPQLINVVRGDMSLIGPRPHPLALDERYGPLIPNYMARYAVRPGLTGLAQITGHRGETPTVEAMAQRVKCDLDYIANWSLLQDFRILFLTAFVGWEATRGKR